MRVSCRVAVVLALLCPSVSASEAITPEPTGSAYNFVSHYSVEINASREAVWQQLIALESWMYDFDLTVEHGEPGKAGEVRRLYAGQDYFIQTTKVIPDELLVFANLPSTVNGEHSTGVAVITLSENDGTTTVRLTMSRRYSSTSDEPNPMLEMRESPEFQERTQGMWQDGFLERLRSLVESQEAGASGARHE